MKKLALALLVSMGFVIISIAQNKQLPQTNISFKTTKHNGVTRCYTMEADSIRRANNSELGTLAENEIWLQKKIVEHKNKYKNDNGQKLPILTIPVVVHVIHNGDAIGAGENIGDAQVNSQIQVLNEDFQRLLGTPGYNTDPVGADVQIVFCMAVVDPAGNPTNGIDRVNMGQATWDSQTSIDGTLKPATIWDPTLYMNMWTVRFGGGMAGTLGYAQFPDNSGLAGLSASGGAANSDGVVAAFNTFGSSAYAPGTYNPPYDLGRTMTHEVGHWLGLRHTWGDANCGNDFCADTPQSQTSNFGCPNLTTCDGNQDMVENYMDYTDDACMNIFTQDQKTRIRTVLLNSPRRMELPSSTVCTPPNPDDGGISAVVNPTGTICGTTTFTPIVTLTNYGNNNLTSIDIIYDLDGGASTTFNWTGTLAPGSTVNVTLTSITTTVGAHTFNVATNLPNGNADANTGNDANSSSFTIQTGNPATLSLTTDCWGYETFWEIVDASSVVVTSGGNTGTTIPPGGGQTAAAGDANAYPDQATISENVCLASGCYDFIIYDDFGDGMSGGGSCAAGVVGDYTLTDDATTNVLATTIAVNADFGNSETQNFCIGSTCTSDAGTMNTTTLSTCGTSNTITATHNGDETLDANDVIEYVLHDGNGTSLGTVTSTSATPTFSFVGGMTTGTTYYISTIVGNDDGSGSVDITDACLSVAVGTPVVWNALPTVVANATSTTICIGSPVTLTGSGAASYTWTNSVVDGVAFNPTATQNYTVTGTDGNGCQNTDNITVTVNALPTVTANASASTVCSGSPVTLTGGGANTYSWDNSVTDGVAFNPTTTQTYTVTGTDANNCQNTASVTVNVNALPTVTANTTSTSICPTDPVTLTGGGANTYSWDNSVTDGVAFNPVSTQTYTVTGTDANNCQNTASVTVTINALPTVVANATTTTICIGSPVTLTGSGAASYTWTNSVVDGVAFNPTATQNYTVTGTDGNGCQNTDNITVSTNSLPVISNLTETCNGTNTSYTVSFDVSGGGGGYVVTGQTGSFSGSTWTSTNISSGTAYSITVTDANGCSSTAISGSNNCNCTSNAGTMNTTTLSVCGTTSSQTAIHNGDETLDGNDVIEYVLHDESSATLGNVISTSPTPTFSFTVGMTTGTTYYISAIVGNDNGSGSVDVTDACLSVAVGTPVVWYALPAVIANASSSTVCSGDPVTLTGSGAASYTWTNGVVDGTAFNPTSTQNYIVTGTDANNCQNTDNITINVNSLPTVVANSTATSVCMGSAVTLTGSGANTYSWDNGVTDGVAFNPTSTQTYTVTGTDANNCSNTDNITVTVNSLPNVVANSSTTSICDGDPVTLNGSGAASYTWTNGAIEGIAFNPSGTQNYVVTGTDANNCSNTDNIIVTVNSLPNVVANSSSTSICDGDPVTLNGSGAASYTWTNGVVDGVTFNPTSTQNYVVTGTDANNCSNTDNITIIVNSSPTVIANSSSNAVCDGSTVTLTGSGANTYTWTNSVVDGLPFTPTGTQSYTVTGTDVNNCTNTDNITITVNGLPTVTANATFATICAGDPVTLNANGATSYTWTNGVMDGVSFNPTGTQSYTVIGTDGNGCQATDNITVNVNPTPTFTITSNNPTTCGGSEGEIILSGLLNTTAYQLTYTSTNNVGPNTVNSNGNGEVIITGLNAGNYTNFSIDLNGCSITDNSTVSLTDPNGFNITTNVVNETCSANNGQIEIITNGAVATIQYSIDNGTTNVTTNIFNNLTAGTYDVAVIDGINCQDQIQVTIIDIAGPVINSLTVTDISCFGAGDGSISVDASGNSTLDYSNNGGTNQTSNVFNNLILGNYNITVTDTNGCTTTQMGVVNEPALITDTFNLIQPICGNDNGSIFLDIQGGITPYTLSWQHDATATNDTLISLNNGEYIVTITDTNNCVLIDTIQLNGSTAVEIIVNSGNESCEGENDGFAEVLNVTGGTPVYSYLWDNGNTTALINNLGANIYQVTVTDINGCFVIETFVISTETNECLNIHNAISPNNDGDNDTWVITGIKGKPNATVQIFNRWGSLIYESTDYQNDWRGTYKGKDLPAGVYYYIVTISEDEAYEGAITILR